MYPVNDPVYDNFDTAPYKRLVPSWMRSVPYAQKWWNDGTNYDPINLQCHSTFGAPQMQIINCSGQVLQTFVGVVKPNNAIRPPWTTYQFSIVPPIMGGVYYFLLSVGAGPTLEQLISEPQMTIKSKDNTLLFRYYKTTNQPTFVWSTGIQCYFRIEGGLGRLIPKIKGEDWEDQPLNLKTNSGIPYREFPLIVGGSYGVPDWGIDKVNRITALDKMFINEKQWTRPKANDWETTADAGYPLSGHVTTIRETINSDSLLVENGNNPSLYTFTVYDIVSDLFGTMNDNGISNPVQITKINLQ